MSSVTTLQPVLSWQETLRSEVFLPIQQELQLFLSQSNSTPAPSEQSIVTMQKTMIWAAFVLGQSPNYWVARETVNIENVIGVIKGAFHLKIQESAKKYLEVYKALAQEKGESDVVFSSQKKQIPAESNLLKDKISLLQKWVADPGLISSSLFSIARVEQEDFKSS